MHPLLPLSLRQSLLPLTLFALGLVGLRMPTVGLGLAIALMVAAVVALLREVRRARVDRLRSLGRSLRDAVRDGVPTASLIEKTEQAIWRDPDGATPPLADGLGGGDELDRRIDELVGDFAQEIVPDSGVGLSPEVIVRERLRRIIRVIAPRSVRPHVLVIAPLNRHGDLLSGAQHEQSFVSPS